LLCVYFLKVSEFGGMTEKTIEGTVDPVARPAGGQLSTSNTKHLRYAEVVHLLIVLSTHHARFDKRILGNHSEGWRG
jgi:hypothetical protein